MHPKELSINDFTYQLHPDRIAQHPLEERDQSRLLIYNDGRISEDIFKNIADHLPQNSMIVFNNTKVIQARIIFKNKMDASIEVFLLNPVQPYRDLQLAIFHHGECTWKCLIGNVKKWREDNLTKAISIAGEQAQLEIRLMGKLDDDFLVQFKWKPEYFPFIKILESAGFVPLPPYIKRGITGYDKERYQTLYAIQDGSVAAPTAGLHFTKNTFDRLHQKKIQTRFITLHVGAGTFLPVKAGILSEHLMHSEQIVVQREMIQYLLDRDAGAISMQNPKGSPAPLICVGTTSLRTVESLYWLGKNISRGDGSLCINQWDPYNTDSEGFTNHESLLSLLDFMNRKKLNQLIADTHLLIAPGYKFRFADGLITNFHLPNSTLLLLVAAFIGADWRNIYEYALNKDFRFLSYGDASLLWRKPFPS
ncbi:MAG: S-adenosylmethionine:tRNA ribosyltransferase-isomerase [Chitinophagales bacterium]